MEIGKWKIKVSKSITVSTTVIEELEEFLSGEWQQAITAINPWWGIKEGIPSPIIRVDMAPTSSVNIKEYIYEVEVRPAGLGLFLSLVCPERVNQWKKILGGCQGFIRIESPIQDDFLAAKILDLPYYEEVPKDFSCSGPYWVRSDVEAARAASLEKISLVPVRDDGDKSYLLKLGMAKMFQSQEELDWSKPFAIKPLVGSRMKGVEIYLPNSLQKKMKGGSTKSRVIRVIKKTPYIVQKFIPPQREKDGWTIWRLFFGFQEGKYSFIGGLWNWRPCLRVHGASDANIGIIN